MFGLFIPVPGDHAYTAPPVAFNCNGWITTIVVSRPANARTGAITLTTTVSLAGLGQPLLSIAIRIYDVVSGGDAVGDNVFARTNPVGGNHVKFGASVVALSVAFFP